MNRAEGVPYGSARDFERALTDRIANAAASSPYGVAEIRRQFAYGRLLARVFITQQARWVLRRHVRTADGSGRPPVHSVGAEPALGGGSDLCSDLVRVRLRGVHHRRVQSPDRRLASIPIVAHRPGAQRLGAGDLGTQPDRCLPRRVDTSLRQGRAIPRHSLIRCLKRFVAREIYQRVMTDHRHREAAQAA